MAGLQVPGLRWGRVRVPAVWIALLLVVVNFVLDLVPGWIPFATLVAAIAVYLRLGGPPARDPVGISAPVRGRWLALNSPADHVPSHGLNAYGQTWAIDLVRAPADGSRPRTGWWPLGRRPERFPGFGTDVLAPAAGTVVRTRDRAHDHWSMNSWPGFAFLFLESGLRELAGPSGILGNHVVLDLGDGVFAVLAHLQRASVRVAPGDSVVAGEVLARCGNSGTSSEPHLHFQLMDHPRVALADGIPFAFTGVESADGSHPAVPGTQTAFVAT